MNKPYIVDAAANFASAAHENGVKNLVVMSMAPTHPLSPSPLGRAQWLAEELFELEGFNCIILRIAALFFENIELLHRLDIEGDGVMRNSFADITLNWMSGADAAKLAVSSLLQPERLAGSKIVYPSGSQQFTHSEVAEKVGQHLKKTLKHQTISGESWEALLLELSRTDKRIDAGMAKHISAVGANLKQAIPVNDLFEKITGESSMSLDEALSSNYLHFGSNLPPHTVKSCS